MSARIPALLRMHACWISTDAPIPTDRLDQRRGRRQPGTDLRSEVLVWPGKTATAIHLYDALDRPDGWTLTSGARTWSHDVTRGPGGVPTGLEWTDNLGAGNHDIGYQRQANGWLAWKQVDALEPFTWRYDALGRVSEYNQGGDPMEGYSYDPVGNPLETFRYLEGTWTYTPTSRFNEAPLRDRPVAGFATPAEDTMQYDPVTGALLAWETDHPDPNEDVTRQFEYDGSGRLRWAYHDGPLPTETANLFYDGDDVMVLERRITNGVTKRTWRYAGWRQDEGGETYQQVLPMARLESGKLRVVYVEPDGHAQWTLGSVAGQADTEEFVGIYGLELLRFASAPDWALDGYHGSEPNRTQEVTQFGARHMVLRDGLWMQPEPLLYLGLTNADLTNPLGYSGLYAAGNPNVSTDPTGYVNMDDWDYGVPSEHLAGVWSLECTGSTAGAGVLPIAGAIAAVVAAGPEIVSALLGRSVQINQAANAGVQMLAPTGSEVVAGPVVAAVAASRNMVNLPTNNASSIEAIADLKEYARRSNEVIEQLGPQTVVGTKGGLRQAASADARRERARAAAAGTPYQGQAGHVPDTAVTGQASPPGGYLDMRDNSNGIAGGCIGCRIGETIDGFTVDGQPP